LKRKGVGKPPERLRKGSGSLREVRKGSGRPSKPLEKLFQAPGQPGAVEIRHFGG
jgi:hypothetical protein